VPDDGLTSSLEPEPLPQDQYERVEVMLVPKAAGDLRRTEERTGLSRTDIINRAVSLYEFGDAETAGGAELVLRRDGETFTVDLL
jgi:hypothetical protein